MIGRLQPGVSAASALAALNVIAEGIERAHPEINRGHRVGVTPTTGLDHSLQTAVTTFVLILTAVSALVLMIACLNVGSVLLVRVMSRDREFAVRIALGAGGARILRQILTESTILTGLGAAAGVLVAVQLNAMLAEALSTLAPGTGLDLAVDWRVLSLTAAYLFIQSKILFSNHHSPLGKLAAHYEAAPGYRELFGDRIALERLYSHEGNLHSSAGAMSTLDLMLHLIEGLRGTSVANRIAYVFNHQRLPDTARKPSRAEGAIAHLDARLGRIVSLMQAAISYPVSLNTIYREAGVEASTARRLFNRILHQSPRNYYRQLRLQYGREIIQSSGFNIAKVAEMTGFSDGSAFSRAYRQVFGIAPGSDRQY